MSREAVRALIPVKVSHPKMNAKMAARIASGTTMRKNRRLLNRRFAPMLLARIIYDRAHQ